MIGTAIAVSIGITVVAFAYLTIRSGMSRVSYYGRLPRSRYGRR